MEQGRTVCRGFEEKPYFGVPGVLRTQHLEPLTICLALRIVETTGRRRFLSIGPLGLKECISTLPNMSDNNGGHSTKFPAEVCPFLQAEMELNGWSLAATSCNEIELTCGG